MTFHKNMKMTLCTCLLITSLGFAKPSNAAAAWVNGVKIAGTTTDKYYGGCMARLDATIATVNPVLSACPSVWVSLDCEALQRTQAHANAMWSQALVAFSLQKTVNVYIDDSVKLNGYCVARRMDVAR